MRLIIRILLMSFEMISWLGIKSTITCWGHRAMSWIRLHWWQKTAAFIAACTLFPLIEWKTLMLNSLSICGSMSWLCQWLQKPTQWQAVKGKVASGNNRTGCCIATHDRTIVFMCLHVSCMPCLTLGFHIQRWLSGRSDPSHLSTWNGFGGVDVNSNGGQERSHSGHL